MDFLTIIACIAIGMVCGMTFEAIYNAETRKNDHERIRALNRENIRLRAQLKAQTHVEVINLPQADRTYHQLF